jgi:hypothetical protein
MHLVENERLSDAQLERLRALLEKHEREGR